MTTMTRTGTNTPKVPVVVVVLVVLFLPKRAIWLKVKAMSGHDRPFYDQWILRERQQEYINGLLSKYQHEPVSDELKKKVYDELMREKYLGNVIIPFRVVTRKDIYGKYPDRIDVILDTKV